MLIDIPILSDLENAAADFVMGEELEIAREKAANMELPFSDGVFENVCEGP